MEIIVSAIAGVVGIAVGAWITGSFQRRKVGADARKAEAEALKIKAEADETIRQTVMLLLTPLQNRVTELETELRDWKNWANRLVTQIEGLGCEPVPFKSSKRKDAS